MKAKHEKLMSQRVSTKPIITYKDTRSSILRNKAKNEKDESEKLYKEVENKIRQDKEKDHSKIKKFY